MSLKKKGVKMEAYLNSLPYGAKSFMFILLLIGIVALIILIKITNNQKAEIRNMRNRLRINNDLITSANKKMEGYK